MAANKIPVEMDLQTARAVRGAKELTKEIRKSGETGKKAGKDSQEGMDTAGRSTDKLKTGVMQLIGAYAGLQGVRRMLALLREETERIDATTRKYIENLRAVMALSALKGMRPEVQKDILRLQALSGRDITEYGPAHYTLLGGTYGMKPERQRALMERVVAFSKTDPRAPLDALVSLFSTLGTLFPQKSALQISNLASQTIESAKSTAGEMAVYLPPILSTAVAGGVEPEVPAAMFAFGTRRGGGVATSGTAARALLLGLMKPPGPAIKEMKRYGFDPKASLMEKLTWYQQRGDELPEVVQVQMGGRRGLEMAAAITADPQGLADEIQRMRDAIRSPRDLIRGRLAEMYGEMPAQRFLDQVLQAEALTEQQDVQPGEIREQAIMKMRDLVRRRRFDSPLLRGYGRAMEETYRYVAGKPQPRIPFSPAASVEQLVEEGYSPEAIDRLILKDMAWWEYNLPSGIPGGQVSQEFTIEQMRQRLRDAGETPMQEPEAAPTTQPAQPTTMPAQSSTINIGTYYGQTPAERATNTFLRGGRVGDLYG